MGTKRVFELSPEQDDKVSEWAKTHVCSEVAKRARHRTLTYSFTPTGIGTVEKVHCSACKQVLDLTDVSTW